MINKEIELNKQMELYTGGIDRENNWSCPHCKMIFRINEMPTEEGNYHSRCPFCGKVVTLEARARMTFKMKSGVEMK